MGGPYFHGVAALNQHVVGALPVSHRPGGIGHDHSRKVGHRLIEKCHPRGTGGLGFVDYVDGSLTSVLPALPIPLCAEAHLKPPPLAKPLRVVLADSATVPPPEEACVFVLGISG